VSIRDVFGVFIAAPKRQYNKNSKKNQLCSPLVLHHSWLRIAAEVTSRNSAANQRAAALGAIDVSGNDMPSPRKASY
jgi:hypothetical protein